MEENLLAVTIMLESLKNLFLFAEAYKVGLIEEDVYKKFISDNMTLVLKQSQQKQS